MPDETSATPRGTTGREQPTVSTSSLTYDDLGSAAQRERRRRILEATVGLASEGGFEQMQMRAVAERADVALGTLYRYFPSKIHLLVSALAQELERVTEQITRRPIPGATPADRVTHVLGRTTVLLQDDPHLTEALTRAFMFADKSVSAEIQAVATQVTRLLGAAMHEPGQERATPTEDEIAVMRVIGDVWLASLVQWVTGRTSATDVDRSLDVAVRLLLR